ncbi:uncharacterized protein DMENIID0001_106000 [Sergentomyia squamirostris]
MKNFGIFAFLFGIFIVAVIAVPLTPIESAKDIQMELDIPEDDPVPVEETPPSASDGRSPPGGSKIGQLPKNPINVIDVPLVCPEGQLIDHTGRCRDMWLV